jgi:hypothetical protein
MGLVDVGGGEVELGEEEAFGAASQVQVFCFRNEP